MSPAFAKSRALVSIASVVGLVERYSATASRTDFFGGSAEEGGKAGGAAASTGSGGLI